MGSSGKGPFRVLWGEAAEPCLLSGHAATGTPTSGCSAGLCRIKTIRQPAAEATARAGGGAGTARLSATSLPQPVCPPWWGGVPKSLAWTGGGNSGPSPHQVTPPGRICLLTSCRTDVLASAGGVGGLGAAVIAWCRRTPWAGGERWQGLMWRPQCCGAAWGECGVLQARGAVICRAPCPGGLSGGGRVRALPAAFLRPCSKGSSANEHSIQCPHPAQGGQMSQEFTPQMLNKHLPGRADHVTRSWEFILKSD